MVCGQSISSFNFKLTCIFSSFVIILTEIQTITTGWEKINDLSYFDDDSIVVSGKKQGKWKMLKYSLRNLKLAPSSSVLGYNIGGMTTVTHGGNQYLAISDPYV